MVYRSLCAQARNIPTVDIATSHLWDILKWLVVAPVLLYLDICNVLTLDYRYFGGSQVVRSRKQQINAIFLKRTVLAFRKPFYYECCISDES